MSSADSIIPTIKRKGQAKEVLRLESGQSHAKEVLTLRMDNWHGYALSAIKS